MWADSPRFKAIAATEPTVDDGSILAAVSDTGELFACGQKIGRADAQG
jgi:hypothetical protein